MKKRLLSLVLACGMMFTLVASCDKGKTNDSEKETSKVTEPGAEKDTTKKPDDSEDPATSDEDTSSEKPDESDPATVAEPFQFSLYYSYDWWTIKPWGDDATSKYWKDTYGVDIDQQKPDADASAKLNLMISSGDLPDVICIDRNQDWLKAARLGIFQDLAPFQANNPKYDENILAQTQDLLKVDGTLYSIPNWARKNPTGGNDVWMYNKKIWEKVGSPKLETFEDLYAFAKKVKEEVPETESGLPVIPFATENNANAFDKITTAFYRSMGGPNKAATYTARIDGKMQVVLRDDTFKKSVLEANKWFNEGLISETQFADTNDQMVEKFSTGRTALLYYDFSQDDVNHFRTILREDDPDNDYVVLTAPVYPPAEGVKEVYPDHKETVGWNVHNITKNAKEPQKIFDFLTHLLTKEGSIEMMYGPQGNWWDELDENGNPILKQAENSYSEEERNKNGAWMWSFCSHSDNVDLTKFAINATFPKEEQSFVISTQADVISPIMFMTDEYVNLSSTVDPQSDLGISRLLCEDQFKADIPKAIMAATPEEAEQVYDGLLKFFDDNNFAEVEKLYDEEHKKIVETQGYTGFDGLITNK